MDKAPQVSLHSTAHFFLEGLNEIGIDYLFCNLGTDHAPLIEEMARWRNEGRKLPVTMLSALLSERTTSSSARRCATEAWC